MAPSWLAAWVAYNFLGYAVIPYVVFRARGYSNTQLNLRSSDRRNDLLVIGVILLIETAAWVHVWAYHAIAPHVTVDTVTITHVFDLR